MKKFIIKQNLVFTFLSHAIIFTSIVIVFFIFTSCKSNYERAVEYYNEGKYEESVDLLMTMKKGDPNFEDAVDYFKKAMLKLIKIKIVTPASWKYDGDWHTEKINFYDNNTLTCFRQIKPGQPTWGFGKSEFQKDGTYEIVCEDDFYIKIYVSQEEVRRLKYIDFNTFKSDVGNFYRRN